MEECWRDTPGTKTQEEEEWLCNVQILIQTLALVTSLPSCAQLFYFPKFFSIDCMQQIWKFSPMGSMTLCLFSTHTHTQALSPSSTSIPPHCKWITINIPKTLSCNFIAPGCAARVRPGHIHGGNALL